MAAIPGLLGTILTTEAIVKALAQDTSQQSNSGLGFATTLHTYSVPAGGLAVNGDSLEFDYFGTIPGSATDARISMTFGATTIFDTGVMAPGAVSWVLTGRIIRTGAATQKLLIFFWISNPSYDTLSYATAAETLSGALDLKLIGNGTNGGDVVKEGAVIDFRGTAP